MLKREEIVFRAHYACLLKVLVFCGNFECTSKRYVVSETFFPSLKREGIVFRAHFAHLSKVLVFCGNFECTSKRYVEREVTSSELAMLASQKCWFSVAILNAPVRGM